MIDIRPTTNEAVREFAARGLLYAILDACDAPAVPKKAAEIGEFHAYCLYTGEALAQAAEAGPYIFFVTEPILDWVNQEFAGQPWGIYAATRDTMAAVSAHLRRLLVVQLPDGKRRAFRFYDPRILKPFLETCSPDQVRTFYGPIRAFGIPGDDGSTFYAENVTQNVRANPQLFTEAGLFPIASVQMDRFQSVVDDRLRGELVEFLKNDRTAAVEGWDDETLKRRVGNAILRARRYDIGEKGSVQAFLTLMVDVGPNFDVYPPIYQYLSDKSFPGRLRLNTAIARVPSADWVAAKNSRDESAWEG